MSMKKKKCRLCGEFYRRLYRRKYRRFALGYDEYINVCYYCASKIGLRPVARSGVSVSVEKYNLRKRAEKEIKKEIN